MRVIECVCVYVCVCLCLRLCPFNGMKHFPSVLCHCRFGDRKGIKPVKTGCWFVGGDILTGALTFYNQLTLLRILHIMTKCNVL